MNRIIPRTGLLIPPSACPAGCGWSCVVATAVAALTHALLWRRHGRGWRGEAHGPVRSAPGVLRAGGGGAGRRPGAGRGGGIGERGGGGGGNAPSTGRGGGRRRVRRR